MANTISDTKFKFFGAILIIIIAICYIKYKSFEDEKRHYAERIAERNERWRQDSTQREAEKIQLQNPKPAIEHKQQYEQGWIRQGITLYEKAGKDKWREFGVVVGGTKVHGEECYIIEDFNGNTNIKYTYVVEGHFYTREGDPHFFDRAIDFDAN